MKMPRRLTRSWVVLFVLTLLVSEGQMWPQSVGGSNLRPSPIGDNRLPNDNTVPLSPRPSVLRPAGVGRPSSRRSDGGAMEAPARGVDDTRQPQRPDKPISPPPPRPTQYGRSHEGVGLSLVELVATTMQIAHPEGVRRPVPLGDIGPRPNWNQSMRPDSRMRERPSDARPNNSEPGPRGNSPTLNATSPKRPGSPKPSNGSRGRLPDASSPFVFPDSNRFVPSEACVKSGRTFCESTPDYPAAYLSQVLDSNLVSRFGSLFGADEVEVSNITQRFDLPPEDETLCQSVEKVIYPTAGQTRDDQWRFIVNQEKFLQGVRIEMCMEEEGKCAFSDSFPLGYQSFCKQKYIYRKLVSVATNGMTDTEEFKLPACCSCHIRIDSTSMRMASDVKPKS